ncbi:uncharacterized protein LOC123873829 isoform X2 [Maniola jurtina]|uniref:uncharacterized protein LOC123873829 isoform X2 n=1 Tax=Maniola jurtina TaxID=191418 RepID=UPI001E68A18B|nr:uncharacterized protein LOC123873829 isoform X2 [Maniola jurtina]
MMIISVLKEVKLKWKKLRDSYRDALKRQSELLAREPGAAPAKKACPWKYMQPMQFLQPHMNVRKKAASPPAPPARGAAQRNGDARSSDDSESEPESEPKRKSSERLTVIDRKLDYLCKAQSKRQFTEASYQERKREAPPPPGAAADALDIFFNSMCQSTKRFPYPTQIKIKKTLFGAVIEAEEALVAEQQSYASLWARAASSTSSEAEADDDKPS